MDYLPEYRYKNSVSVDVSVPPCGGKVAVFSELPPVKLINRKLIKNTLSMFTKCNHAPIKDKHTYKSDVVTIGFSGNTSSSFCPICDKQLSEQEATEKKERMEIMLAMKKRCQVDNRRHALSKMVSYGDFNITKREEERANTRYSNDEKLIKIYDLNKLIIPNPKYVTTKNCMNNSLLKEDIGKINTYQHSSEWKADKNVKRKWQIKDHQDIEIMKNYFDNNNILKADILSNSTDRDSNIRTEIETLNKLTDLRLSGIMDIMSEKYLPVKRKSDIIKEFTKSNTGMQIVDTNTLIKKPIIRDADPKLVIQNIYKDNIKIASDISNNDIERNQDSNVDHRVNERSKLVKEHKKRYWRDIINEKLMTPIRQEIFSRRLLNKTKDSRRRKWVNLQKYNQLRKAGNERNGHLNIFSEFGKQILKSGIKNKNGHINNANIQWVNGDVSKRQEYDRSDDEEEEISKDVKDRRKLKLLNRKQTGDFGKTKIRQDLKVINKNYNSVTGNNTKNKKQTEFKLDNEKQTKDMNYNTNNNNNNNDTSSKQDKFSYLTDDMGTCTSDRRLYQFKNNYDYNINNNGYYKQDCMNRPRMVDKSTFVRPKNTSCKCCEFGCPADSQEFERQQQQMKDSRRRSSIREDAIYRAGSPTLLMSVPPSVSQRQDRRMSNMQQPMYSESLHQPQLPHQQQQHQQHHHSHMPLSQSITSGILRPGRMRPSMLNSYIQDANQTMKIEVGTLLKGLVIIFVLWLLSKIYTYGIIGYIQYLIGMESEEPQEEVFMRYFENKR